MKISDLFWTAFAAVALPVSFVAAYFVPMPDWALAVLTACCVAVAVKGAMTLLEA